MNHSDRVEEQRRLSQEGRERKREVDRLYILAEAKGAVKENDRLRKELQEMQMRLNTLARFENAYGDVMAERRRQEAEEEAVLERLHATYPDRSELVRVLWQAWFIDKYSRTGGGDMPRSTWFRLKGQLRAAGIEAGKSIVE